MLKTHDRRALLPASGIPLLYFAFAHLSLALAFGILTVRPDLPGGFFHHPRMVAVIHLVTLGWISGSILGAFYIVGPLALRLPLRPGWRDRAAFGAFAAGVAGMVAHVWIGEYRTAAWFALPVASAVLHVGLRAWIGLPRSPAPWPVKLHVALAFVNMLAASGFGVLLGLNRMYGWFAWSPMSAAFAHAHLAAVGWAVMMVVGLSYRLIPMILPAAMPSGSGMAASAGLLEAGVVLLLVAILASPAWVPAGALLIVSGLACFVAQIRRIVRYRLPPPAALPRPDWATWQTHAAFAWLLAAAALGLVLAFGGGPAAPVALGWLYGTSGLVGFLAQVVVGIQGRLLPLHGWYRAFEAGGLQPPPRSAHSLASPGLARSSFVAWLIGVPLLASGLAADRTPLVSAGSAALLAGVGLNVVQALTILGGTQAAGSPPAGTPRADPHS